ncbi:MAG TPA: homoserine O-succinyltransferase, partial [Rhizomicrobium sp.]|nr:homoserine O-succinyltransferase [Rhizomicrobium sp.]
MITIGLVNNMPDSELQNTENQFRNLLTYAAAAADMAVQLRVFSIPEVPRSQAGKDYANRFCDDTGTLTSCKLDALIVTGSEPRAHSLKDERYWNTLRDIIDWAADNTYSAIWSCLAAHACVLHIDGIARSALPRKLSGVFDCAVVPSELFEGAGSDWGVPHSRYNGLQEQELKKHSYQVLSHSPSTGPDCFVKQLSSLFVFLQGHPEYDLGALLREYRRDVGRFLRGASENYPDLPDNYFDDFAAAQLCAFRKRALRARSPEMLAEFPSVPQISLRRRWQTSASGFYASWLRFIATERGKREARPLRRIPQEQIVQSPVQQIDGILFPASTIRRRWQDHLNA